MLTWFRKKFGFESEWEQAEEAAALEALREREQAEAKSATEEIEIVQAEAKPAARALEIEPIEEILSEIPPPLPQFTEPATEELISPPSEPGLTVESEPAVETAPSPE